MVISRNLVDQAHKTFGNLEEQLDRHGRLIQGVARRQYVLFLGAGIASAVGYPGWEELVNGVRLEVGRTIRLTSIHPLEQAQVIWNYFLNKIFKARPIADPTQRNQAELEFNRIVLNALEKLRKPTEKPAWFNLLRKYLPNDVVTTNWDKVIENELFDNLVNCFCFHGGAPVINRSLPNLYKIHGDIDESRYLVFTEDQFFKWEQDDDYLVAKLRVLFSENVTLCLGYTFRDPNVQHQHFRAFLRFQGSVKPVYLLIDPARHHLSEWGFLREQREYFGSRNVTLLFGSIPDILSLLDDKVAEYSRSALYHIESIEPVMLDLIQWKDKLELTGVGQHSLRLPRKASEQRLLIFARGLIQIGLFPEVREIIGLQINEGLTHDIGVRLLEDLKHLLSNQSLKDSLSESDYNDLVLLLNRFTTKDSGAWQFVQQRERFTLFLDFLPLIPINTLPNLAAAFAEHLLFAGPTYGDCWGSWNDINRRIYEIPIAMLRPLLEEMISSETWAERKDEIRKFLQDDKAQTRMGIRLRLLKKHPGWEDIVGL